MQGRPLNFHDICSVIRGIFTVTLYIFSVILGIFTSEMLLVSRMLYILC